MKCQCRWKEPTSEEEEGREGREEGREGKRVGD